MAERTSFVSLSLDRIARTPLRNKRASDRASLTSVSRTIAAPDIGSRSKSWIESESMTITSSSVRADDAKLATAPKLPAKWNSAWWRTMLSSLARRSEEVATTAILIAPPAFRFDIRYRAALSPKVIDTGLISPARMILTRRTSPTFALASES